MPTLQDNSLRQAAVFVRSLDADAAATMLARLSAGEAKALRSAIRELGEVRPEERRHVASELDKAHAEPDEPPAGESVGVELDLTAGIEAPSEVAAPPAEYVAPSANWLTTVEDAEPQAIADYLAGEQPAAVAVVLGSLPPRLSAGVLECFPASEQADLLGRLAEQDEADPDSVQVLASGLAAWIDEKREAQARRSSRLAAIRDILDASPASTRDRLLDRLSDSMPELAPKPVVASTPAATPLSQPLASPSYSPIPTPEIAFESLHRVDSRTLAAGLAQLTPRTALLALAAAPTELVDRLASGLPRAASRDLRDRIKRVGPTTLTEIDRAQLALAESVSTIVSQRRTARAAEMAGED